MAYTWNGVAGVRRAQEVRYERDPMRERQVRKARAFLREHGLVTTGSDAEVLTRANTAYAEHLTIARLATATD